MGPGIYHRASEGETLWSISRAYRIEPEKIVRANKRHLDDPDRIKAGQNIYIPGARRYREAVSTRSRTPGFIWPVRGEIIDKFGQRGGKRSLGIGIQTPPGTPVMAAEGGRVLFVSEEFRSYGKTVIIEHPDSYCSVYAHNSIIFVNEGQAVNKGDIIAESGSSGRVGSPRLYFEIRYEDKAKNPLHMLP